MLNRDRVKEALIGVFVVMLLFMLADAAYGQNLMVNDECEAPIDQATPVVITQFGDIIVYTEGRVFNCGITDPGDQCGDFQALRTRSPFSIEKNNLINLTCSTFDECFGGYPPDQGAWRVRLNAGDKLSIPVSLAEGDARFTFEGNVDIADTTTVTLSSCDGGLYFPAEQDCSRTFGATGTSFSFGTDPQRSLCVVSPGEYWLVIGQVDEEGNETCGGDQLCTVFFGTVGFNEVIAD